MRLVLLQFNYRKLNRAIHMHELVRKIPLNRLLLETDAPYFAPCASAAALPKLVLMESSRWRKFQEYQFKKISQDRLCPAWPRPPGGRCSCLPQGSSVEKGCWHETCKNSSFNSILNDMLNFSLQVLRANLRNVTEIYGVPGSEPDWKSRPLKTKLMLMKNCSQNLMHLAIHDNCNFGRGDFQILLGGLCRS